jgi:hypothetical protein
LATLAGGGQRRLQLRGERSYVVLSNSAATRREMSEQDTAVSPIRRHGFGMNLSEAPVERLARRTAHDGPHTRSRNDDLQAKLFAAREWDFVVCDEAHRLSASYFGGVVKYAQRYQLGQRLSGRRRHFLLMTATPHSGKEADFQLFMALLDGDRFEGRFREASIRQTRATCCAA